MLWPSVQQLVKTLSDFWNLIWLFCFCGFGLANECPAGSFSDNLSGMLISKSWPIYKNVNLFKLIYIYGLAFWNGFVLRLFVKLIPAEAARWHWRNTLDRKTGWRRKPKHTGPDFESYLTVFPRRYSNILKIEVFFLLDFTIPFPNYKFD